jgi:mono/diheme cytochrome c family protein
MKRTLLAVVLAGCTGGLVRDTTPEPFAQAPEQIARGKYLVDAVAACGACHTGRASGNLLDDEDARLYMAGGNTLEDEGNFKLYVPNLTSDSETGLGKWSDDKIARATRDGVDDEGNLLFPVMPFPSYRYMSDADVRAVVAWLRTVPKVRQVRPPFDREIPSMAKWALRFGLLHHEPAKNVPSPNPKDRIAYGKYLMYLGHCEECHALGSRGAKSEDDDAFMGGSDKPFSTRGVGKVWATNLTPDADFGIRKYSDAQLKDALRKGSRLEDGKPMAYPMSSYITHFSRMTEADLDALVAYLRTLRPVHKQVPARELTAEGRKRFGG